MATTWPANVTVVTVVGTYLNPAGRPVAGLLTFTPTVPLLDGTSGDLVLDAPITVLLASDGSFTVDLAATDDTTLAPSGWLWQLAQNLTGVNNVTYQFALPGATSPVNLATLAPVSNPGNAVAYVSLSAVGAAGGVAKLDGTGNVPADELTNGTTFLLPQVDEPAVPLTRPRYALTLLTDPATTDPNLEQVSVYDRNSSLVLTYWLNERGMRRGEQPWSAHTFDTPYSSVMNYHNATAGSPALAYTVEIRGSNGTRTVTGGLNMNGLVNLALQPYTSVTVIDPGGTGTYVAATSDFQATTFPALAVRLEADDVVRLRGIVGLTPTKTPGAQDVMFTLPAGFAPSANRAGCVGSSFGKGCPIKVLTDGSVVNTSAQAAVGGGGGTYYFDDVTFVR